MRLVAACALLMTAATWSHAGDTTRAEATLVRAVSCDLPVGSMGAVNDALRALKAKRLGDGSYKLLAPVHAFGVSLTEVAVDATDVETYIATFRRAKLETIAAAAQLPAGAGGFARDTAHGRLVAEVRDRQDVWLTCTVLQ